MREEIDMKKYTVKVFEEGCGAFVFKGVEAANKNAACANAIQTYMWFVEETEIAPVSAVAQLEK